MRIDFPDEEHISIEKSGCQSMRIEMKDDLGLPFCVLELSLNQALAIANFLASHKHPSDSSRSGWELK